MLNFDICTGQGVRFGDLYYKTTTNTEWTKLGILNDRTSGGRESVTKIQFDGGIEVCQVGAPATVDEDHMWKVRWESKQYDSVHVDEFTSILSQVLNETNKLYSKPTISLGSGMDHLGHIAIQFHPLSAPTGSAVKRETQ